MICSAFEYVRINCEYYEYNVEYCLHKDNLTDPARALEIGICTAADGTYPPSTKQRYRRLTRSLRTDCSFSIKPDNICGGTVLGVPAVDRAALILYRCGPAGQLMLRPANNNQQVYLFCSN